MIRFVFVWVVLCFPMCACENVPIESNEEFVTSEDAGKNSEPNDGVFENESLAASEESTQFLVDESDFLNIDEMGRTEIPAIEIEPDGGSSLEEFIVFNEEITSFAEEGQPTYESDNLCGLQPGVAFCVLCETLQFQSADSDTCLRLERLDISDPNIIYQAIPFKLLQFKVGHANQLEIIDLPENLNWTSTHHNWNDEAEALGPSTRYHLITSFYPDNIFLLSAYDIQTNKLLWGVELLPFY